MYRLPIPSFVLVVFALASAGCGGAPGVPDAVTAAAARNVAVAREAGAPSPSIDDAVAIAGGRASHYANARTDESGVQATPRRLRFDASARQTVTVTVDRATTVIAASADQHVVTVSPYRQSVTSSGGGTLTFTVTPRTTHPSATIVCFLDRQWRYACIVAVIGGVVVTPTPSPSTTLPPTPAPTTAPTPTAPPTPSGLIVFDPMSPLAIHGNATSINVKVSEGNYQGIFTNTSCTTTMGFCFPDEFGGYRCDLEASSNNLTTLQMEIADTTQTSFDVVENTRSDMALTCNFVFTDSLGNQATYTVNAN